VLQLELRNLSNGEVQLDKTRVREIFLEVFFDAVNQDSQE